MTRFAPFLQRPPIGWWDIADIVVVSFLIYEALLLIRGTRAMQMAVGSGVLQGLFYASGWGRLETVNFLIRKGVAVGDLISAGWHSPCSSFRCQRQGQERSVVTSKARVGRNIIVVASVLAVAQPASSQIVYPFPPYGPIYYDSSLHLQVTPREAEVYVDGYYAGIVDNFDGMWQRLRLEPGQHEIVIYREGYRSHSERIYLAIDRTFKIRTQLERLAPGEPAEPRPVPLAPQASAGAIQADSSFAAVSIQSSY